MNRDFYIKANASASAKEWVRPSDWLPMPTNITSADQIFVGLHAVFESGQNYCAFLFTTSAGQYQVDWGDGTVTLHNSNTIAQKNYDYSTISNSTICSRGYKQVIIKVTPVSGNLLTCNFQQRFVTTPVQNQIYATGFLDCILSMPNGNFITFGGGLIRHSYVERFDVKTIGNVTNMSQMFNGCTSLQSVPLFNTQNVTTMQQMFFSCTSLNFIPNFNTALVTNFTNFANGCNSLDRCTTIFRNSVGLQNCQLSKDALVEIFTNLTDRTSKTSATIDITGNWGATALTPTDRLIATNKNWTITG